MLRQVLPKSEISARENLQWLFILRNLMIFGEILLIIVSAYGLRIPLPQEPLLLTIIAISAVNLYTWIRLQNETPVTELEIFSQLVLDVFALACLLYLTGGATNPIIWIFLLPLILTAITLPTEYTWYMVLITNVVYTILIVYHKPLPAIEPYPSTHAHMQHQLTQGDQHYFNLHIFGMWFGFVLSAGLVAYFVVELAKSLRERERNLADAREKELRNERVIALGTLAASAAHDMGTPLGTIAIITHEFKNSYPEHRFPDLHEKFLIMEKQIDRCKEALSVMSASAGELRAESGEVMEISDYFDEVLNQWRTHQPEVKLNLFIKPSPQFSVKIVAERTLTLSLINILNNAGEATPRDQGIDFHLTWDDQEINVIIRDYGSGVSQDVLDLVGKTPVSTKKNGLGVGLFLTYSTITRIGGTIGIRNLDEGGASTEIMLPVYTEGDDND